jgi:hypothetical protein
MDYSKLPKLSQTPAPPATEEQTPPAAAISDYRSARDEETGMGAEIWLSAIIGLVMLMLGWTFARYLGATLTGQPFHTNVTWTTDDERAGKEVGYFELTGYTAWTDAGTFLFGVALLLEAAALAVAHRPSAPRKPLIGFALLVCILATTLNLLVAGLLLSHGLMPIISILIVAFGGYMAAYQWKLLKALPQR